MGLICLPNRSIHAILFPLILLSGLLTGCQLAPPTVASRIILQRSLIDFTGLAPVENFAVVKTTGAVPEGWEPLPLKESPLYTHEQWRSPSIETGVGVAYIHVPIPVPASAILWFARHEYTKREDDGRSLGEWTDTLGRQWFEAENNKYHVRGYAITHGTEAWIVYCGYRRAHPPAPRDISLAARSVETMIPGAVPKPIETAMAK